jgi:hypothetical protein
LLRANRRTLRAEPLRRRATIRAPKRLQYYVPKEQRQVFEQFAAAVSDALRDGVDTVTIDFRDVERLYPCGVLLLMGLVDHWCQRYPGHLKGRYPSEDLVEQMLQHVEVLQKLGLEPRKEVTHDDVTRWHYFTGTNVDAEKIEPFMAKVGELLSAEEQSGLYDCIAEAMTNVKHHAYEAGQGGRWWMFATASQRRVFVAMHDRGASIPSTLLEKPQVKDYLLGKPFLGTRADGELIASAAGGRTSTRLPYRGKGLPEMVEYTKATSKSDLAIYSRNGFYRLFNKAAGGYAESRGRLEYPVVGTLVLWMINLSSEGR